MDLDDGNNNSTLEQETYPILTRNAGEVSEASLMNHTLPGGLPKDYLQSDLQIAETSESDSDHEEATSASATQDSTEPGQPEEQPSPEIRFSTKGNVDARTFYMLHSTLKAAQYVEKPVCMSRKQTTTRNHPDGEAHVKPNTKLIGLIFSVPKTTYRQSLHSTNTILSLSSGQ